VYVGVKLGEPLRVPLFPVLALPRFRRPVLTVAVVAARLQIGPWRLRPERLPAVPSRARLELAGSTGDVRRAVERAVWRPLAREVPFEVRVFTLPNLSTGSLGCVVSSDATAVASGSGSSSASRMSTGLVGVG
jgi:hypothetical protein